MKGERSLVSNLRRRRLEHGWTQQYLAGRAGVTRQTISGIEAGEVSASVGVALRLARALMCRVEDLFSLEEEPAIVTATPASEEPRLAPGTRLRLAQLGDRLTAYPLVGIGAIRTSLYTADGVVEADAEGGHIRVRLYDHARIAGHTVVVAGCDPALALLAEQTRYRFPSTRVIWTSMGSVNALGSLAANRVHAAGIHWHGDGNQAEPNMTLVRTALPGRPVILVNVAYWDEGWIVAPGNPKGIAGARNLLGTNVRLVNRERGAGARHVLDRELTRAGLDPAKAQGYDWEMTGHLELAQVIALGWADAGIGIAPAARLFGLDFIPLGRERFDLVIPLEHLETAPVRDLMETLDSRAFRNELASIGGYDTTHTGKVLSRTTS